MCLKPAQADYHPWCTTTLPNNMLLHCGVNSVHIFVHLCPIPHTRSHTNHNLKHIGRFLMSASVCSANLIMPNILLHSGSPACRTISVILNFLKKSASHVLYLKKKRSELNNESLYNFWLRRKLSCIRMRHYHITMIMHMSINVHQKDTTVVLIMCILCFNTRDLPKVFSFVTPCSNSCRFYNYMFSFVWHMHGDLCEVTSEDQHTVQSLTIDYLLASKPFTLSCIIRFNMSALSVHRMKCLTQQITHHADFTKNKIICDTFAVIMLTSSHITISAAHTNNYVCLCLQAMELF